MKHWKLGLALLGTLMALTSCICLFDTFNARGADADMPRFFQERGITITQVNCSMLRSSRDFTCEISLAPDQVRKMRDAFKMQENTLDTSNFRFREKAGCEEEYASRPGILLLETKAGRTKEMGQFNNLIIYFDANKNRACMRSTYGYG